MHSSTVARGGGAFRACVLLLGLTAACAPEQSVVVGAGGAGGASGGTAGTGNAGAAGSQGPGSAGSGAGSTGTGGQAGTVGAAGSGVAGTTGNAGSSGAAGAGAAGTAGGGRGGVGGRGGAGAGGAAGGSAGASGGSGGAAGATSASGCAGKTYKLCEDFETGTVGAFPTGWTALNGYGTDASKGIGLANDQFHSGSMALKSNSINPGEQRVQRSLSALGATATKHWGRIFYKVQSPAPKTAGSVYFHTTFAALQGTTENRVVDSVQSPNGTHQWIFNVPDDSCCTGSAYSWTFDAAWHCAEWYVDVSTQSYRFFTDSTEVTSIGFTGKAAAKMSSYTSLAVGAIFYQTPPSAFVIWFDDLAIDDNQIGCQ